MDFSALQRFRNLLPLFSHPKMRLEGFTLASKSAVPRVWLPFLRVQLGDSLGLFFSPNALGLYPSELFSIPVIK